MSTDVDRLLTAADPHPSQPRRIDDDLAAMASDVASDVVAHSRRSRLKRLAGTRRRALAVGLTVGLVAVPTTAWATAQFLAETGQYGAPGMTENDTSQWIRVCAPDFPAYHATLPTPSDPAPEGLTWPHIRGFVESQIANLCQQGDTVEQVTGLRAQLFEAAESVYECRAFKEHQAGDDAAAARDAQSVAATMDRLNELHVYGDNNWVQYRDAAARSDFDALAPHFEANVQGAPTAEGVCR
jgi:hypothetical protein